MAHKKTKDPVRFFNIPRDWVYLIGFEYTKINRHGETKLTKGQKPVTGRIDHLDLFLLDEIRGFKERGNAECFKEALALSADLGLYGKENDICDRVLQLCGLGLVKLKMKPVMGGGVPLLVLEVDHDLLDDMIEARRESVLLQQRMDSEPKDFYRLLKKSHLLKQYLQQYPKEYSQESLKETDKERSQAGPRPAVRTRPGENDFYVLDSLEEDGGGQQQPTETSPSTSIEDEEAYSLYQSTDIHTSTGLNNPEDSILDIYGEQPSEVAQTASEGHEDPSRFDWVPFAIDNDIQLGYFSLAEIYNMKRELTKTYHYSESDIDEIVRIAAGREIAIGYGMANWEQSRIGKALCLVLDDTKFGDRPF